MTRGYVIELTCRLCRQPYAPSRDDIRRGPETYHRCPECRDAPTHQRESAGETVAGDEREERS
jgi:hypothetical protein